MRRIGLGLALLITSGGSLTACGGSTSDGTGSVTANAGGAGGQSQGGSASSVGGAAGSAGVVSAGGASTGGTSSVGGNGGTQATGGLGGMSALGGNGGAQATGGLGGMSAMGGSAGAGGGTIAGSYTMVFSSVMLLQAAPDLTPASVGVDTRLDIRAGANGGYDALLTPSFEQTWPLSGVIMGNALVLTGPASIFGQGQNGNVDDQWMTLTLPLDGSGGLTGAVAASGESTSGGGDVEFDAMVSGVAQITPDHVLPQVSMTFGDPAGPANAMLPWDPIVVATSEGVDATELTANTSIAFVEKPLFPFTTKVSPAASEPTAWGGARSLSLFFTPWDLGDLHGPTVTVAAGVKDPSGNLSAATQATSMLVLPGAPLATHAFQGDVVQEASWGQVTYFGSKSGSDPHCENNGTCVQLGPYTSGQSVCDIPTPSGIAGLLTVTPGGSVAVRYRVTSAGSEGMAPFLYPAPFEVVIATHDGTTVSTPSMVMSSDFQDQGMAAGAERFVTAWRTDTFTVTGDVSSGELGFEVRGIDYNPCEGGLGPPQSVTQTYIGSVSAVP